MIDDQQVAEARIQSLNTTRPLAMVATSLPGRLMNRPLPGAAAIARRPEAPKPRPERAGAGCLAAEQAAIAGHGFVAISASTGRGREGSTPGVLRAISFSSRQPPGAAFPSLRLMAARAASAARAWLPLLPWLPSSSGRQGFWTSGRSGWSAVSRSAAGCRFPALLFTLFEICA